MDKPEDKYNPVKNETSKKQNDYGEGNETEKDSANKEFKRLLYKQIPKDNEIWKGGYKCVREKLKEEPYLSIINEIKSKNTKD